MPGTVEIESEHEIDTFAAVPGTDMQNSDLFSWRDKALQRAARRVGHGLRRQLAEVAPVVRRELPHVPETPFVGDVGDPFCLGERPQPPPYADQSLGLQIGFGRDAESRRRVRSEAPVSRRKWRTVWMLRDRCRAISTASSIRRRRRERRRSLEPLNDGIRHLTMRSESIATGSRASVGMSPATRS